MSDDTHQCPVEGCATLVQYDRLMCGRHWRLVDGTLQRRLYRTWNHGEGVGTALHTMTMEACVTNANLKAMAAAAGGD